MVDGEIGMRVNGNESGLILRLNIVSQDNPGKAEEYRVLESEPISEDQRMFIMMHPKDLTKIQTISCYISKLRNEYGRLFADEEDVTLGTEEADMINPEYQRLYDVRLAP